MPTPFHYIITYKVLLYAPAERADIHPLISTLLLCMYTVKQKTENGKNVIPDYLAANSFHVQNRISEVCVPGSGGQCQPTFVQPQKLLKKLPNSKLFYVGTVFPC
jgi:hypothetical protein